MWVAFAVQKLLTFFQQKNIRILYIESAKTVNEMTLNKLLKLTTLWTTGPRTFANGRKCPWTLCYTEFSLVTCQRSCCRIHLSSSVSSESWSVFFRTISLASHYIVQKHFSQSILHLLNGYCKPISTETGFVSLLGHPLCFRVNPNWWGLYPSTPE